MPTAHNLPSDDLCPQRRRRHGVRQSSLFQGWTSIFSGFANRAKLRGLVQDPTPLRLGKTSSSGWPMHPPRLSDGKLIPPLDISGSLICTVCAQIGNGEAIQNVGFYGLCVRSKYSMTWRFLRSRRGNNLYFPCGLACQTAAILPMTTDPKHGNCARSVALYRPLIPWAGGRGWSVGPGESEDVLSCCRDEWSVGRCP